MLQTWRWFGPDDPIEIQDLLQVGVEGVVTALYDIPPGQAWPLDRIEARKREIFYLPDDRPSGLRWQVVESLPVSEDIKTQSGSYREHIDAYKDSLKALATAGLRTVCYNFMPILDWTRTDLRAPMLHGGNAMCFDLVDFVVFDVHLLARPTAAEDYGPAILENADKRFAEMSDAAKSSLVQNIVAGLPGANDHWTLDDVRSKSESYARIDASTLRQNLTDFLAEVAPIAQKLGIGLCAHPDDPPFSLLGLPRILSSQADFKAMVEAVDIPSNGITFCTGSLGVAAEFDAVEFVANLGPHIHFVHLRNTTRKGPISGSMTSFFEDAHLEGDTDMPAVLRALLVEETRRRNGGRPDCEIPFRPDHGQALLSDLKGNSFPGYPLIGRMRGLAELRGVIAGLASN